MKKILFTLVAISPIFFFNACQGKTEPKANTEAITEVPFETMQKGFDILETNCFTCHSPKTSQEASIAPSMTAIKEHYLYKKTTQDAFVNDMVSFVLNPSVETSKMPEAIEKYNLMPKLNYSKEQLSAVAAYIYNTAIEQPEWFEKNYETERKKYSGKQKDMPALEKGQKIAMQAKSVLGKNLMGAINANGTDAALSFCNEQAFPILDSMSVFLSAKIKRVSDMPRNENHQANEAELAYILNAKEALANNEKLKGKVSTVADKILAYYPITTNKMCLQCHGTPKTEVKENTMKLLTQLYPNDKAIGYSANQLRGIWVIEFDQ